MGNIPKELFSQNSRPALIVFCQHMRDVFICRIGREFRSCKFGSVNRLFHPGSWIPKSSGLNYGCSAIRGRQVLIISIKYQTLKHPARQNSEIMVMLCQLSPELARAECMLEFFWHLFKDLLIRQYLRNMVQWFPITSLSSSKLTSLAKLSPYSSMLLSIIDFDSPLVKNMCLLCVSVSWCVAQNDNRANLGSNGSSNVGTSPSFSRCVMLSNIHDGRTMSNSLRFFNDATLTRPEEGQ